MHHEKHIIFSTLFFFYFSVITEYYIHGRNSQMPTKSYVLLSLLGPQLDLVSQPPLHLVWSRAEFQPMTYEKSVTCHFWVWPMKTSHTPHSLSLSLPHTLLIVSPMTGARNNFYQCKPLNIGPICFSNQYTLTNTTWSSFSNTYK